MVWTEVGQIRKEGDFNPTETWIAVAMRNGSRQLAGESRRIIPTAE